MPNRDHGDGHVMSLVNVTHDITDTECHTQLRPCVLLLQSQQTLLKLKHFLRFQLTFPPVPCHDASRILSQHAVEIGSHVLSHALQLRMHGTRGSIAVPFRPVRYQLTHVRNIT